MVAIADARYETSFDNSFIETVVKYSVNDGETWETQIAIKNSFFFSTLICASSYTVPSDCRRRSRATTKVSCYEATAIERTFRCGGPVQCPVIDTQPRCLDILEADAARFPAGQLVCLWKLADPAAAAIASWHCCFDVDQHLGYVRIDSCVARRFSLWGRPCHRNRI
ncbi:trans-sialidase, putative [Trypanosoma cruzi marinkellei]|uniref:Trans-sialidase, putative n=1 Tax=Trypanosoma cruzi marinkellei TaxID=85056 RepID=K2NGV6_TRYCR|nr:trans-sialidase, putative [Trypanosoma cruzi marinkellei]